MRRCPQPGMPVRSGGVDFRSAGTWAETIVADTINSIECRHINTVTSQNLNFSANWICRIGFSVDLIRPNVADGAWLDNSASQSFAGSTGFRFDNELALSQGQGRTKIYLLKADRLKAVGLDLAHANNARQWHSLCRRG